MIIREFVFSFDNLRSSAEKIGFWDHRLLAQFITEAAYPYRKYNKSVIIVSFDTVNLLRNGGYLTYDVNDVERDDPLFVGRFSYSEHDLIDEIYVNDMKVRMNPFKTDYYYAMDV